MSTYLKAIFLAGIVCFASACEPRGETRSLDQVYESSKQRFSQVKGANVPQGPAAALGEIPARLEQLAAQPGPQSANIAGEVAELLAGLIDHAGYTSRPALGEIITQYRMLSQAPAAEGNAAARLLVARTYSLLASELETTRFAVQ